jgi:drug/metabolite transporter (DMT)-like permease
MKPDFLIYSALTSAGQFSSAILMMRIFRLGSFAVGTMIAKADAVMTAVIGSLLFSEVISGIGWIAIVVTVSGVLLTSAGRLPARAWRDGDVSAAAVLFGPAARIGLLIALVNALSFLALREAILSLEGSGGLMLDAALAGTVMTAMSALFLGGWLLLTDRANLLRIGRHVGLASFVGLASAGGTAAWYIASSLTNASYVAAVGQLQIVAALVISRYWFREEILPLELAGIGVILAGVVMFRLA